MKKFLFTIGLLLSTTLVYGAPYTPFQGGTGTSTSPSFGQVLMGLANGTYAPVATSSLGISSGGSGTVTSVSVNTPTGLTASTSTCNTACLITLALQSGYNIPLTASTTNWNTFYNASATLPYYLTFSYASSSFPSFTYGSSTYYLATNPSGYITNSVSNLTNYPTYTYASSTYASTTYVNATFVPFSYGSSTYVAIIGNQTIAGNKTFTGTSTFATSTMASTTSNFLNVPNFLAFTIGSTTGLTSTNLYSTNYYPGFSNSFVAVDQNGKLIATSTPGGTTYTGTYPIIVSGSVISSGFSTSTTNIFSAVNTFNGQLNFGNASGTGLSATDLFGNIRPTGITNSWISVDTNGKIIATSTPVGGSSFFATTSINGLATTTFLFSTSSDTNIGLGISTSTSGITFTPQWIGTLADSRITSASTWNAKLGQLFSVASGTGLTVGNLFATSSVYLPVTNTFLATDLTGKLIATTTPTGGTFSSSSAMTIGTLFSTSTINISGTLRDSTNASGTSGQVLSSTGTGLQWITNAAAGVSGSGVNGFVSRWTSSSNLSYGSIIDDGSVVGINATSTQYEFYVKGDTTHDPFSVASSTGNNLFVIASNGHLEMATSSATTTTPTSGLTVQAKTMSGLDVIATKSKLGREAQMQNGLWNASQVWYTPGIVAAGLWQNTVGANLGTAALVSPTVSTPYSAMRRTTFASVVTTPNQQVGTRSAAEFFRGNGGTLIPDTLTRTGGFFYAIRFGFTTWTNGDDLFIGLSSCTTACITGTTTLTNLPNTVGIGVERNNNTIVLLSNDASGVISTSTLGITPATNGVYDFYMYQAPNDATIYYRIDNASTTSMITQGSLTTNLPATTTLMTAQAVIGNGLNATVGAATLGISKIYIETER